MVSGTERFIIVENDAPEFVVLSLEEYQRLVSGTNVQPPQGVNDQLQGISQDTADQDVYSSPAATDVSAPERFGRDSRGSVRLEDLPL